MTNNEVHEDIIRLSRPTFISGAFPYVVLCCASILEQRRQLDLLDKLSVAVTKGLCFHDYLRGTELDFKSGRNNSPRREK